MFVFHPGVHVPPRRRDRSLPKKKRYVYPPVPVNPSLLQAWRIAWTGKNEPPLFGRIRLLGSFTGPEFLRIPLYCQDRTITEWNTLFTSYESYDRCPQKEWSLGDHYNPFIHWKAVGTHLRIEYQHQMKLRWLVQKWVQRLRIRIYKRRLVGETDLHSLEPITPRDAVQVNCYRTKSLYQFHLNSILRMIRENLSFEQWGRADPLPPRNPYTNQAWSLYQLMGLVQSVQIKLAERGKVVPSFLSQFVEAEYCVTKYYKHNKLQLGVDATTRFFQSSDSVGVRYELLYQLFDQIDKLDQQSIYQCVKRKECPGYLQHHWEQLLQNKWIHDNYGYSPKYGWRDSYEQTITIQRIYSRTLGWYNETQTPLMQIMLEELEEHPYPEENDDAASVS